MVVKVPTVVTVCASPSASSSLVSTFPDTGTSTKVSLISSIASVQFPSTVTSIVSEQRFTSVTVIV